LKLLSSFANEIGTFKRSSEVSQKNLIFRAHKI
jgi:hypothetical protein